MKREAGLPVRESVAARDACRRWGGDDDDDEDKKTMKNGKKDELETAVQCGVEQRSGGGGGGKGGIGSWGNGKGRRLKICDERTDIGGLRLNVSEVDESGSGRGSFLKVGFVGDGKQNLAGKKNKSGAGGYV